MKTPLTRERLRQHITYSLWKYALLVVLAVFCWNLIFTVTAYRPPREKVVELYIYGYGDTEPLDAYAEKIRQTEMPDMEQIGVVLVAADETYGIMALTTRLAAGEGNIYLLPRENFQNMASGDWFTPLDDQTALLDLCAERGVNLERGWRRTEENRDRHLYGIPLDVAPGLAQYLYSDSDYFFCIPVSNPNLDNSLRFLSILLRDMGPEAVVAKPAE